MHMEVVRLASNKNGDILIVSVMLIVGAGIFLYALLNGPGNNLLSGTENMLRGWSGGMTSGEEAEQAAMYAHY